MNFRSIATSVRTTLTTLDTYGAKLPKPVRSALDAGLKETAAVAAWEPTETGSVVDHAYAAIAAGRDPGTDEAVLRALLTDRLEHMREQIHQRAGAHVALTITEHPDALVTAFDGAYQQHAAEPIAQAAETLERHGITGPDADSNVVLGQGLDASSAWVTMRTAHQAHNKLVGAYKMLTTLAEIPRSAEAVFYYADPAGLDLIAVRNLRPSPHPWAALNAGMALSIATPVVALDRQARAADAMARGQVNEQQVFAEGFKRMHGVGAA